MSPALTKSTFIRPRINLGYNQPVANGVNSLYELIAFNALNNPRHVFGQQSRSGQDTPTLITFLQLQLAVDRAAAWLNANVVADRGRPVALFLSSDVGIFIYLAALLRNGTPVVILSARLSPLAVAHLLGTTRSSVVLTNTQLSRAIAEVKSSLDWENDIPFVNALSYQDFLGSSPLLDALPMPGVHSQSPLDPPKLIMHSSGSTGLPKPIYHAHNFILGYASCHNLPEQGELFRFNVSTLPLYHGFGLLAPCLALSIGMPFFLPPSTMIPTARTTLAMLRSSHARYLFSVPSILEDIYHFPGSGLETLQSLEIIAIGGAPMKESLGHALSDAGINLLNHWGATEIGAIAPIQRIRPGYDWRYITVRTDIGLEIEPMENAENPATYRIIGHPVGWNKPFVLQDVLEVHRHDKTQFRIQGRADDLLVLSTGEKVRPLPLESAVAEHPEVRAALVFGDGRPALGLLIETAPSNSPEKLITSLISFLNRGNSKTDAHGNVSREMLVVTSKPFIRTDKGSIARKATIALFEQEIQDCYEHRQQFNPTTPFPSSSAGQTVALRAALQHIICDATGCLQLPEDSCDFFEAGIMNSLQASRARHAILCSLRATPGAANTFISPDFCFQNPSIDALCDAITQRMSPEDALLRHNSDHDRILDMKNMVKTYRAQLETLRDEAITVRKRPRKSSQGGSVVLLTGSTGNLGCQILFQLAHDRDVRRVICLNRCGAISSRQRQLDAFLQRGMRLETENWSRITFYDAETSMQLLGLNRKQYCDLLSVTHIIHNAWPVSFKRRLASFNGCIKTLLNLIRLAILCRSNSPTRLSFVSSIAVVGQYHGEHPSHVPEVAVDAECTARLGYAEAKWVGESILEAAADMYGSTTSDPLIATSSMRIGQMTGPEGSGAWNASEHIPRLIQTSKSIGALPALNGSLSWMPVNRAATALLELVFSNAFQSFYHLENPARQSWVTMVDELAFILGGSRTPLPRLPYTQWLQHVQRPETVANASDDNRANRALEVLDFLQTDFIRMAEGRITLDTSNAREDSPTMRKSGALGITHLNEYVAYWKHQDWM